MKKVLVIALSMMLGAGSSAVWAQVAGSPTVTEIQVQQDEFVKIDPADLPQAVAQTLAKDYAGTSVKEAYVKETDGTKIYKIIVVSADGAETTVLLNEKGETVKEE